MKFRIEASITLQFPLSYSSKAYLNLFCHMILCPGFNCFAFEKLECKKQASIQQSTFQSYALQEQLVFPQTHTYTPTHKYLKLIRIKKGRQFASVITHIR